MTDKKTEALKLALDVLTPDPEEAFWFVEKKKEKVITAIREALADSALDRMAENARELGLDYEPPCKTGSQCTNKCQQCEQPEQQSHCNDCGGFDPECPLVQSAQKQEPVAEVVEDDFSRQIVGIGRWHRLPSGTKLFTSPPASKPWVGLTDEERGQVYSNWRWNGSNSSNLELCRAIEAKLREKNA